MEWFTIKRDNITGEPADVELQIYESDSTGSIVKAYHINSDNFSIFDIRNTNNTQLRVLSIFQYIDRKC